MLLYVMFTSFLRNPTTILILPPIAITVGIFVTVLWWTRSDPKKSIAIRTGLVTSAIIGTGFILWLLYTIRTSRSSTACIGYLFLPYYAFLVCAATYLISWAITTILLFFCVLSGKMREIKQKKWSVYIAVGIIGLSGFWAFKVTARSLLLKKAHVATSESELIELSDRAMSQKDIDLLAKLVNNPNTSEKILKQIYFSVPESTFQYPGSQYSPVFFELARNKKTPPDILTSLSEKRSGERFIIATNPNTPVAVLERLAEDKDSLVRTWVSANPNVTKEILIKLKNDPDGVVRSYANTYLGYRGFSDK